MFSQKWLKNLKIFFSHSIVYGQRCFLPKIHKNWPYHFGDIATIPWKTWFFTIFTFSSFLTHPNDQKMFQRARSQFFHVLKHQKNFRQNWGTLGPKVYGPAWIQSYTLCTKCRLQSLHLSNLISHIMTVSTIWFMIFDQILLVWPDIIICYASN